MNAGDPFVAPVDPLRAEDVMHEALQTPLPGRIAVVEQLCGSDTALCAEVKSLLQHLPDPENPEDPEQPLGEVQFEGQVIGGCRVESLLGRGGTGRVFKAMQEWPPRPVALKILRPELITESARRRFRRETRALARLDHPGVARIHAAGLHHLGGTDFPFVIMELVADAKTLTEWWRSTDRPLHDRLLLFADVCEAVHHGHVRGLVHRDLKPSNVLVDGAGAPKVIDFGIAAVTTDEGAPVTITRAVAGTPGYMAPEQFEADRTTDARSDVHGLGLLLYECLAGKPAFAQAGLSMAAAARTIAHDLPTPLGFIDASMRGELETIVSHAICKSPDDRYQSAHGLASDLRRFLSGHPIVARRASVVHRARLFARRNPLAAVACAIAAVTLVIGVGAVLVFGISERRAAARATEALARTERALWISRLAEFSRAIEARDAAAMSITADSMRADSRWPVRLLQSLADESVAMYFGQSHYTNFSAMGCASSPDGSVLAVVGDNGNGVLLLDGSTMRLQRTLSPGFGSWSVAFDPVHERLLSATARTLMVWDKPWMDPPRAIPLPIECGAGIAASPDGSRAVVSGDGRCCMVDLESGQVLATAEPFDGETTRVAWSPDGAWIATSGASRTVRLLRASDLSLHSIIPAPDQRTLALDFDPSSRWLAFAGDLRFLWVVDVTDPSNRRGLSLDHSVWGLKWNPDGRRIAIADRGSGVRIVDAAPDGSPLKLVGSFSGHHNEVWCVDWSRSGERLYSSGQMEAHAWTSMPRVGPVRHELGAAGLGLERMPDGSFTAITADASLWALPQTTAEAPSRRFNAGPFDACAVAGQAAHDRWAWIDRGGNLLIASPRGGEIMRTRIEGFAEAPSRMAFSPSGRRLAIVGKARNDPMVIVDANTGASIARLECSRQYAANALLWQDDDTLMRGDLGGTTIHHRDVDGDWIAGTPLPANWSYARRASDESAFVFELVGAVQERHLRDGHRVKMFHGMSDMGFSAARSPDGTLVAAVGTDRRLHIWDNETQEQLLSLSGHPAGRVVTGVEFSGDGQRVVTLDNQGGWVVWDTRHARERAEQPRLWDQ